MHELKKSASPEKELKVPERGTDSRVDPSSVSVLLVESGGRLRGAIIGKACRLNETIIRKAQIKRLFFISH